MSMWRSYLERKKEWFFFILVTLHELFSYFISVCRLGLPPAAPPVSSYKCVNNNIIIYYLPYSLSYADNQFEGQGVLCIRQSFLTPPTRHTSSPTQSLLNHNQTLSRLPAAAGKMKSRGTLSFTLCINMSCCCFRYSCYCFHFSH